MGKRGKSDSPIYVQTMVPTDKTQTISEIKQVMADVKTIDDSIKKHPIPEPTVKK